MKRLPIPHSLILVTLWFALPATANATNFAADFLHLGFGARALSLGDALTASAQGPEAVFWNPAALSTQRSTELLLMHSERYAGAVKQDNIAIAAERPDGRAGSGLGVGLIRVAVDDVPRTSKLQWLDHGHDGVPGSGDDGEGDGRWTPGERVIYDTQRLTYGKDEQLALLVSYGRALSRKVSVGVTAKTIRQEIGGGTSFGLGADLACRLHPIENYLLGIRVSDLGGTHLWWSTGRREKLNTGIWVGQALRIFLPWRNTTATFSTDSRFYDIALPQSGGDLSPLHSFGTELSYSRRLHIRLGIRAGDLTAGVGVSYNRLTVDYAFLSHNDLGDTHRVGLRYAIQSDDRGEYQSETRTE